MSLRQITPCDYSGVCPYNSEGYGSCEYWCGAEEPQDYPEAWECGVDPIDIFCDADEAEDIEELEDGFAFPQCNPPAPIGTPAVWKEWEEQQKESQ